MTSCQVINHTPAGYALRQTDQSPAALRIGELIALRVEGRLSLQVAMVRWFRNTLKGSALEFGCELLSDNPEAAAAAAEDARETALTPVVVIPEDTNGGTESSPPQLIVPAGSFGLEQAVTLQARDRHRLRRAHQARRAGPRLRAVRIRRGRLTASPCFR